MGTMEMWATFGSVIWPEVTSLNGLWLAKRRVRGPGAPVIARSVKSARPFPLVSTLVCPPRVPPPDTISALISMPAWASGLPLASYS